MSSDDLEALLKKLGTNHQRAFIAEAKMGAEGKSGWRCEILCPTMPSPTTKKGIGATQQAALHAAAANRPNGCDACAGIAKA